MLPTFQAILSKIIPNIFPQSFERFHPLPCLLKQFAGELFDLVYQQGQHHQILKHRGEMPFAVTVIVLETAAPIFQRVEGVFDFPSAATGLRHPGNIGFIDFPIRNPSIRRGGAIRSDGLVSIFAKVMS